VDLAPGAIAYNKHFTYTLHFEYSESCMSNNSLEVYPQNLAKPNNCSKFVTFSSLKEE
jgi:hypothetical protein